jgi:hypothetical protein
VRHRTRGPLARVVQVKQGDWLTGSLPGGVAVMGQSGPTRGSGPSRLRLFDPRVVLVSSGSVGIDQAFAI